MTGKHCDDSIVSLIGGIEPYDLPRPLHMKRVIQFQSENVDSKLPELRSHLG